MRQRLRKLMRSGDGILPPWLLRILRIHPVAIGLVLLLLLLFATWSNTAQGPLRTVTAPTPTLTPTPTQTPTPTVTPIPGPRPVASRLAVPPASCPPSPHPQTISFPDGFGTFSSGVRFFGEDIVWIPESSYPTVVHLEDHGAIPWPAVAIVWEVGPDATDAVSVRATNLQTGEVLWWVHGTPPDLASQTLTLDANVPGPALYTGIPEKGWQQFQSALLIPEAGCYALDATWAGGSWRVIFAAGA
jgi:hypothetical protein